SGVLLAGDAAASLDPLSSQGIEKAIASAEQAALAASTLLEGRVEAALVHEHLRVWNRRLWRAPARATQRADVEARPRRGSLHGEQRFWRSRHAGDYEQEVNRRKRDAPKRLRPRPDLEEGPALVQRGSGFEVRPGWRRKGSGLALERLGPMSVRALLDACGAG